jgi:hypothetical protein
MSSIARGAELFCGQWMLVLIVKYAVNSDIIQSLRLPYWCFTTNNQSLHQLVWMIWSLSFGYRDSLIVHVFTILDRIYVII